MTCVRTRCRTSSVRTAVLHSYMLRVCHHYRWLLSYALLLCRQHRRPASLQVGVPRWYALRSYIRTLCLYAVNTADPRLYALQNLVGRHRCPTFAPAARLPPLPLATFVCTARLPSTSSTCVRMHCRSSLVCTAGLHSYVLLVCRLHRRPAFVCVAEARWYALLSYIHTRCLSAINTVDQHSYALQNLVGTHCCPTFVRAARLPSISSTCIRTRCRTSLVRTAVLYSHLLSLCRHYRCLHSYALLVCCSHR